MLRGPGPSADRQGRELSSRSVQVRRQCPLDGVDRFVGLFEVGLVALGEVNVDRFEEVYQEAKRRGIFAEFGARTGPECVFRLGDVAQMYIHDPAGNLIEVDYPDIDDLDRSVITDVVERETAAGPEMSVYTDSLAERLGH